MICQPLQREVIVPHHRARAAAEHVINRAFALPCEARVWSRCVGVCSVQDVDLRQLAQVNHPLSTWTDERVLRGAPELQ